MMKSVKYLDVLVFIDDFNYLLCKYIVISMGYFNYQSNNIFNRFFSTIALSITQWNQIYDIKNETLPNRYHVIIYTSNKFIIRKQ